jgi:hypothetical protein
MASQRRLTTLRLIEEVRQVIGEDNTSAISDEEILAAINRGQDQACSILSRQYESPLLTYTTIQKVDGQSEYTLPEDVFEDRLMKVEVFKGGIYHDIPRISFMDISTYESPGKQAVPTYYAVYQDKIRFVPVPSGVDWQIRAWYLQDPVPLVKEQGRLTSVNVAGRYITLDDVGSELDTSVDDLKGFVNLVDKNTGRIKATLQIQSITGKKLLFKQFPVRTSVQDRTVVGEIPATVEPDDYICPVFGSCLSVLRKPLSNYIVAFAEAELRRKLGEQVEFGVALKKELEQAVERSWANRPSSERIQSRSRFYPAGGRPLNYLPRGR